MKVGTPSPQFDMPASQLISRLSYSHLELIVDLEHETQRAFYELEAIRGNWSVRELKRQIGSLYFERSGLSHNKAKLSELAQQSAEQNTQLNIRERIMRFKFVKFSKEGVDEPVMLKSLSDGEHQLLHSLGLCLLFKNTNCLLLLDEPETHFNPEWRSSFISRLRECFTATVQVADWNTPSSNEISITLTSQNHPDETTTWAEMYRIPLRYAARCCSKAGGTSWRNKILDDCHNDGLNPDQMYKAEVKTATSSPWHDANFLKIAFLEGCESTGMFS